MVTHNAEEGFYQKLLHIEPTTEYTPDVIKNPPEEIKALIGETLVTAEASGLYELCQKYLDIALNAPKWKNSQTCDVSASFQYEDIDIAKEETRRFVKVHNITDTRGLMSVIKVMHQYAVDFDDERCTGGMVQPDNYTYDSLFFGKFHNFCELPPDAWEYIEKSVLEYIS